MKKLLIADDSPFMRRIIREALNGLDVEILEAKDGMEALEMFRTHRPNLMTLDIVMPGKSGLDILREIMHIDQHARVIICSSMVNWRTDAEAKEAGAIAFIKKPFQNKLLAACIHQYI